ncbi:MAG: dihydrodipicolinate synthase family protein [Acidimicrobiales bacterium]
MIVSPFDGAGDLDEAAFTRQSEILRDAGVGIIVGSYGTGEGRMLTRDELRRMYRLAVTTAGGTVPVVAAGLGLSATGTVIELANEAHDLGVSAVQIHPPLGGPVTVTPTAGEISRFYDDVLAEVTGPVVLSNEVMMVAYAIDAALMADLVTRHSQVVAVNWTDANPGPLVDLMQRVDASAIAVYVGLTAQLPLALSLGAVGGVSFEQNIIPRTCAAIPAAFAAGDLDAMAAALTRVLRLNIVLAGRHMTPRSTKAAMSLLGCDSMNMRPPFQALGDAEHAEIAEVLRELGIENTEG